MTTALSASLPLIGAPFAWVGRQAHVALSYFGGLGLLLATSARAAVDRDHDGPPMLGRVMDELSWMLAMGMPLVALVHAGLGSFLSMQAYFGGTFVDGTGAVVGVGLLRNVAPQMAGLVLAGLLAARIVPELRGRLRTPPAEPAPVVNLLEQPRLASRPEPRPTVPVIDRHEIAARLIAGGIAGPVLALWGALVGLLVGLQVGRSMVGVTEHSFFLMFWDMLWYRDVVGVPFKGVACGMASALLACHEGLRGPSDSDFSAVSTAACRAACLAAVAVLLITSGWFMLFYHAGPAFGPTLLEPSSL